MKKLSTLALIAGASLFGTSPALANSFKDIRMGVTANEVEILINAETALGTPSVRSGAGFVRLGFGDMADPGRFTKRGDGDALTTLRLLPANDALRTGVALIQFADRRRIYEGNVKVDSVAGATRIRIPRTLLPTISDATARQFPSLVPSNAVAGNTQAAPAAATAPASAVARASSPSPSKAASTSPSRTTSNRPTNFKSKAMPLQDSGNPFGTLIGITLLLGAAYLGIRYYMSKKSGGVKNQGIEILAARRLGPRHQLVLVRALGKDHLLSIHGSETRRIASMKSSAGLLFEDEAHEAPSSALEPFLKMAGKMKKSSAPDPFAMMAAAAANEPSEENGLGGTKFGPQLLKLAMGNSAPPPAAAAPESDNDAVSMPSLVAAVSGAQSHAAPRAPTAVASVAGLIRLRDKVRR